MGAVGQMLRILSRGGPIALAVGLARPLLAQETSAWSVFQATDPVECFTASTPASQANTQDGEPIEVARGSTVLYVLYRPSEGLSGQVVFKGGYPSAPDSPVTLDVDGTQFTLFLEGDWAWPADPEEDSRIVDAFRSGSEAVVTAQSGRGTVVRDTFSLRGFTASLEEAQRLCAD